jgi:hypothetical protein
MEGNASGYDLAGLVTDLKSEQVTPYHKAEACFLQVYLVL